MTAINAIADILNTGKSIAGLAGGIGNARGAIGKINSAAGAALNIAAGATSITNSIKSLFGGDGAAAPDPKRFALIIGVVIFGHPFQ